MKLHQIIENTSWLNVWDRLRLLYSIQQPEETLYKVYQDFKSQSPEYITTTLVIDEISNENETSSCVSVFGLLPSHEIDYAMEFNSVQEWLGMDVEDLTLQKFSPSDIAAHCIMEMVGEGTLTQKMITLGSKKYEFAS